MQNDNQEKIRLKVFGYGLVVILGFFAARLWFKQDWASGPIFFAAAMTMILCLTIFRPVALNPFYGQWMKVAHAVGTVLTQILLTLLFYGIFAPAGIVLRILRKDLLDRTIEINKSSYWIPKEGQDDKGRYQQQF